MSAQTIIGTCSPWICIWLFFINVLENVCAESLIHDALCFPSVIKKTSKYRNISGDCWIPGGSKSQIFVKIKFYGIYEFMIYCIHKCSKELFKAFYWFSRFLPFFKFVKIISSLHILTKIGYCRRGGKSTWPDRNSNPGPLAYRASTLITELLSHTVDPWQFPLA